MKTTAWRWLVLFLIPGCVLVQPLDEANPANADDSGGSAGSSKAGSGNSGGRSQAGGGNAGRAGSPAGGAANGGAPSGVDFSLFTGNWTVSGGTITTICDGDETTSDTGNGGVEKVVLGTESDLIFYPGSDCEILADVDDRSAFLNSGTLPCSFSDGTYYYYTTTDYFAFAVSDDERTAGVGISTTITTTDLDDNVLFTCQVEYSLDYKR